MQRSCDRLVEEMLKKEKEHSSSGKGGKENKELSDDNYDEDDFENSYENDEDHDCFEEDDYKLVDEEIMSTSIGKRDASILKDIIEKSKKSSSSIPSSTALKKGEELQ
jgi:hypothetical protein